MSELLVNASADSLERFVEAQAPVFDTVLAELEAGAKRAHWMWFVFPQLRGLGHTSTSRFYGIQSAAEALAYWRHPLLGPRLKACVQLLLASADSKSAHDIFGSPDDLKLRSCLTLFRHIVPEEACFGAALEKFYQAQADSRTLDLLAGACPPKFTLVVHPMPVTAFIVRVPEAEACVRALRERFDASVQLGVPAHITVLVPFMAPDLVTETVLQDAQAALNQVSSFAFSLDRVARFPATTYLAPEPAEPFIELTRALVRRFPEFPPFRGEHESIVPHLTVANGDAGEAERAAVELDALLRLHGQIRSVCASVSLLENSSGRWKEMHVFNLPRGVVSADGSMS